MVELCLVDYSHSCGAIFLTLSRGPTLQRLQNGSSPNHLIGRGSLSSTVAQIGQKALGQLTD